MFDPSEQILVGMTMEEENRRLNSLYKEIEDLLLSWRAYDPHRNSNSPDAVVAMLLLQTEIRERRAFILGSTHQLDLPF